jgi:PAS domain S-box-containing protein
MRLRSQGWGYGKGQNHRTMSNAKQTGRITPASRDMLMNILETLPGALFVVDDTETIVYANASAQDITGATGEELCGKPLWPSAPQLVSISLYQAVQKAKLTQEPTAVEYLSPITNVRLHVSLSHVNESLVILFQEHQELFPFPLQHTLSHNEQIYRDLLESYSDGVTILTPDGLVLDINQRPLVNANLQREMVVGKSFTDLPAWSYDLAVQQQMRRAIAQASRGDTVRFAAKIQPRTDLFLDVLMTITPHCNARQQVEYLICVGQDVTERKHTEDKLRSLVDAIPHFVWIAGSDGSTIYHNQRLIDFLAMTHEQTEGAGWIESVHPDDQQRVWEAEPRP